MQIRSPFSFLLRIGTSLLVSVGVLVVVNWAASKANPSSSVSHFDDARGYQIFTSRCEVCHAKVLGDLSRMGPNLGRIGVEAASRRPGLTGPEYILESILDPGAFTAPRASGARMPAKLVADLPDDDIRNLVRHVAAFGAVPDPRQIRGLAIPHDVAASRHRLVVRRDILERGERIFRARCQSCHSLHNGAEHLVFAPTLFGVGFPDEKLLRDSIRHARVGASERYASIRATLKDGSVVVGSILDRTPERVTLLSSRAANRGRIVSLDLDELRKRADGRPDLSEPGPTPELDELVRSLTPDEIDALVALLKAFN
jgi:cytochrome c2